MSQGEILLDHYKTIKDVSDKVIQEIQSDRFVFVLSPKGTDKVKVMDAVEKKAHALFDCYTHVFELDKYVGKGGAYLYEDIIKKISSNKINSPAATHISDNFIETLNQIVTKKTILFFKHFIALDEDFYTQFSQDCRKIHNKRKEPTENNGLKNLIMVFSGSRPAFKSYEKSTFWGIVVPVEVVPLEKKEALDYIKKQLKIITSPPKKLVEFIHEATFANLFLTREFIRIIETNDSKTPPSEIVEKNISNFIEQIWNCVHHCKRKDDPNYKLNDHFNSIVASLQSSAELASIVLDLMEGKLRQGSPGKRLDEITITGVIKKDDQGFYSFTNSVYENFLKKLFKNHFKGDFCLFHLDDKSRDWWQRAQVIYNAHLERDQTEKVFGNKDIHFKNLFQNLVKRLRSLSSVSEFLENFGFIISIVLDSGQWVVFENKSQHPDQKIEDPRIKPYSYGRWLSDEASLETIARLIKKSIEKQIALFDWTRKWIAVPVFVREDFRRIFVAGVEPGRIGWYKRMIPFIQDSLNIYYYHLSREKEQKQLEQLKKQLSSAQKFPVDKQTYRNDMNPLWNYTKSLMSEKGMAHFSIFECLPDHRIFMTESYHQKWQTSLKSIAEYPVLKNIGSGQEKYYDDRNHKLYLSRKMSSGADMILEIPCSECEIDIKKEFADSVINMLKFALDRSWDLKDANLLKKALSETADSLYIIDRKKRIIFCNSKLKAILKTSDIEINTQCCHKIFQQQDKPCRECRVDNVFEEGKELRLFLPKFMGDNLKSLDVSYEPLKIKGNKPIAVAIRMRDNQKNKQILDTIDKLEQEQISKEMEKIILSILSKFGFKRVFQYKQDIREKNLFISEEFEWDCPDEATRKSFQKGEITFVTSDEDSLKGRVAVWHRKGMPINNKLKTQLHNSLKNSPYSLKESTSNSWKGYKNGKKKPNFWVTIPIISQDRIVKFYSLDNWTDEKDYISVITIETLQHLDTFSRIAGQILENAKHREYLKWFQTMISHGTNEPIEIIRMAQSLMVEESDVKKRKAFAKKAEAAAALVQAQLGSIITIEKGVEQIKKEKINIRTLIKGQFDLFTEYAKEHDIQFQLVFSHRKIYYYTSPTVLLQILNNLAGNCFRHFNSQNGLKNKQILLSVAHFPNENKLIITLKDTGVGLPEPIIDFFKTPFKSGAEVPKAGLGLLFSRELAHMLGGLLELIEPGQNEQGTTFQITLQEKSK